MPAQVLQESETPAHAWRGRPEDPLRGRAKELLVGICDALGGDAATLNYLDPETRDHMELSTYRYSPVMAGFLREEFVRDDPVYARLSIDPSRLYTWADVPGFGTGASARKAFLPAGFHEGCSVPLFAAGSQHTLVGTCHVSFRRPVFPGHGSVVLEMMRPLLAELAETARTLSRKSLTQRELDVLVLLAGGLSNTEIAARLCITASTVRRHVEHILAKLLVGNRVAAAVAAVELGLVPSSSDHAP